jgi:hypothetical protein
MLCRSFICKELRGRQKSGGWAGEPRGLLVGLRDHAGALKSLSPEGVSYRRAARRVAGEALSPKVWLRWAKRSTLPGPNIKVPPS